MKKFIAFHGTSNSGIQTKEQAHKWASDMLNNSKITKVLIAEVIEIVEHTEQPIKVSSFFVELNEPSAKAA